MRASIRTTIETPLCCKELAVALTDVFSRPVSVHFIYKMRHCGFTMEWNADLRCEASTVKAARLWLKKTKFRVVNGRGKI